MSVALETTRKPITTTTTPASTEPRAATPKPAPKPAVVGVAERSAAAPAVDPRSSAGISGLRGDLALRNQHFVSRFAGTTAERSADAPRALTPEQAQDFVRTRLSFAVRDDGGLLGWAKDKGGDLVDGTEALVDGAQEGVGDLVDGAQDKAEELAEGVEDLAEGARDKVGGFFEDAREFGGRAREYVERGVDQVEGAFDAVTDALGDAKDAVDVEENIDALGPGDKYKVAIGGDVSVEGLKGYAKSNVEVVRAADGTYTVSADGELGGGLYGQLGAKAGGNASLEAEGLLGAGGKVEMRFDSAEDAQRAADALLRTGSPAYALLNGGPPSKDDLRFLAENTSAVEFRGNGAAKIAAELGVGVRDLAGAGLFASGDIKQEVITRLELPVDGRPAAVSVREELSGKVDAGAQAGIDVTRGTPGNAKKGGASWALQGNVTGKVTAEAKITLAGVDPDALLRDPLGTITASGIDTAKNTKATTTVTLEGQGTAGKNGSGIEAKLSFEQSPGALLDSGALGKAARGDFAGAIDAVGRGVPVDATIRSFDDRGISARPELRIFGFGGGLSFEAIRRDFASDDVFTYRGNAADARDALIAFGRGEVERWATHHRGIRTGRMVLV